MLNVFLCEDNCKQRELFKKYIDNIIMIENLDMKLALSTDNAFKIIEKLGDLNNSGVYFLDIDLNSSINGLDLAARIREYDPRGFICFITSHSEMTYLTFQYRVEAMDFILKNNIEEIKNRIHYCLVEANKRYSTVRNNQQDIFTIKLGEKVLTFEQDEILFIETSFNTHKLILHTKYSEVEFYGKLKDVEVTLNNEFIRVHKSFIVNKKNIKEIDKENKIIYMKGGKSCLASIRLIKNILKEK